MTFKRGTGLWAGQIKFVSKSMEGPYCATRLTAFVGWLFGLLDARDNRPLIGIEDPNAWMKPHDPEKED